jgi:60 kDa SS-A/Ro ribonucleoprotein
MANKSLFSTHNTERSRAPEADAVNDAGGVAYKRGPKELLAQYAVTGCFGHTYYVSDRNQLNEVKSALAQVDEMFIAKLAIYARDNGYMKDMPAFMTAKLVLGADHKLAKCVFDRVIDNARMLRNFVQFVRSGVFGRKSMTYFPRRLVQGWFDRQTSDAIFRGSVGNDPSLADVIKMTHPKPNSDEKAALFGYLIGRSPITKEKPWLKQGSRCEHNGKSFMKYEYQYNSAVLPPLVKDYGAWKHKAEGASVPDVPFQMLDGIGIGDAEWKELARNGRWQFTRMNLNNFLKHGVFEDKELKELICERLSNRDEITRARQFPYQLLTAYLNLNPEMPQVVKAALEQAMEVAVDNVPAIEGRVYVFPDISGSMHSPVTQGQSGRDSKTNCIHVAALMAAAILRKNPEAKIIPFSDHLSIPGTSLKMGCVWGVGAKQVDICPELNPRDTIMTNARLLADLPAGGTNCSLTLDHLNTNKFSADVIILISDYESWLDNPRRASRGTGLANAWTLFKQRNKHAKLVCLDITPHSTTQVQAESDPSVLQVGGFSDSVFDIVSMFARDELSPAKWVGEIEAVELKLDSQ